METVCIKIEDELLARIEKNMKEAGYSTKTEFIREALRKKLEEYEKERLIKRFLALKGKAKKKTTDEERERIRQKAFEEMVKEKGWN